MSRPRARDLGITPGVLPPGPLNTITDIPGVAVGHATLIRGEDVRTGVTAILPHTRTGSAASNGSGDYAIAFSTARGKPLLANEAMSPLFLAVIEATEEAVYNSLFRAKTMTGSDHTIEALPLERTVEILRRHGAVGGAAR